MSQFFCALVALVFFAVMVDFATPKDDSDPPDGRSGVTVITDNLTGCQYLRSGWFGSITPRIGTDYMQVGCRIDEGSDADAAP